MAALVFLTSTVSFAQTMDPRLANSLSNSLGQEYYVGQSLGRPLVTINLLSGVRNAGIYHIPTETNLMELISYAGGLNTGSDISKISIRSTRMGKITTKRVDLEDIVADTAPPILLQDKDTVLVPDKTNYDNTIRWLTLATLIMSTVLTYYTLRDYQKR